MQRLFLFVCALFGLAITVTTNTLMAQNRSLYRDVPINGKMVGDANISVSAEHYFSTMSQYENVLFSVENLTNVEIDVEVKAVITYTCGRVTNGYINVLGGGRNLHLKPNERIESQTWLKETTDKKCINNPDEDERSTIVGIAYEAKLLSTSLKQKEAQKTNLQQPVNRQMITGPTIQTSSGNANTSGTKKASNDDFFWNGSKPTKKLTPQEEEQLKSQQDIEAANQVLKKRQGQLDELRNTDQEITRKNEERSAKIAQSYYAFQSVTDAKNTLNETSHLNGNYNSAEELEADFKEKYNSINSNVNALTEAKNQQIQSTTDIYFANGDATTQATGEFISIVGGIVNNAKSEKEKKQRMEELKKERTALLADMETKKRAYILDGRKIFLAQFLDGGLPLSSHKLTVNEVYCFAYVMDKNRISDSTPKIYLTDIFRVTKYSDNTWPFKTSITDEISKLGTTGTITLVGYYASQNLASDMRESFIRLAKTAGFSLNNIVYKEKKMSASSSNEDFWNTGNKKANAVTEKKDNKDDNFWNN